MEEESPRGGGGGAPRSGAEGLGGGDPQDPEASAAAEGRKGKSCKGCLYYSSLRKSQSRNPMCFGISRTLPQVPSYIVGESEIEAMKDGRNLSDFKYACVGYSVFLDKKGNPSDNQENQAELPFCVGIEHIQSLYSPKILSCWLTEEPPLLLTLLLTFTRKIKLLSQMFSRNAGLVASGVARNLNKVGNYIKENIDDILYPYRRRPK
ncbi:hypothetical protein ACMD2_17845 [Ananas comosus]|uniref:DUF8204 domain-containing protein n=1 Tax=Ananas comosus TaxID=4615 RepID=A0A199W482_ANACO|nr:hypothetical protein ACMD2_17845 [Ananas comosus]